MKRNPTMKRANNEGVCRFPHENSDASTRRRALNVSRLGAVSLLSGACLLGTLGCEALHRPENVRHGHAEYALKDQDMSETWSTAASDVSIPDEICVVAKKPSDDQENFSRGQDKGEATPSFTQRIKNIFHPNPYEGSEEDILLHESARSGAPYSVSTGSTGVSRNDGRQTTYVTSNVYEQSNANKGSFWSKLFHTSPKTDDDEFANYKSNSNETIGAEMARRSRASSQFGVTLKIGSQKSSSSVDRMNSVVEQYDQTRFMPSSRDIEKYYEPSGRVNFLRSNANLTTSTESQVNVENNVSQTPRRSRSAELAAMSTSEERAYRSHSYAPTRTQGSTQSVYSSERPARRENVGRQTTDGRLGSMSLLPGVPAEPTNVASRVRTFGSVRPVPDAIAPSTSQESVGLVSYMERSRERRQGLRLDPNSLFGWSSETYALLSNTFEVNYSDNEKNYSDVDFDFAASLGSKKSYSWFNSNQRTQEPASLATVDENPGIEISQLSASLEQDSADDSISTDVSDLESPNVSDDLDVASNDEQEIEGQDTIDSIDSGSEELSLDEIFDSMASRSKESNTTVKKIESDISESVSQTLSEDFEDRSNVPLKQSDAKPAEYVGIVPLNIEQDVQESDFPSIPEEELADESIVELESPVVVPDSVDERKTETGSTPLTQEEIAWVEHIKNAIESLLAEREQIKSKGGDVHGCDARLRLLYLVIGEYDRSIQEIHEDSDPLKVFWEKECRGLGTLLHNKLEEIDPSFVAERLRSGLDSFSGLCSVKIRKAALVNAPACYGLYEEHKGTYAQGDVVYAYTELDFITSEETTEGYEIDVECRWRLLNSDGKEVAPFEVQRCSNVSETKLRDVVLNVSVPLPSDVASGNYTLELEVVDMNAETPSTAIKKIEIPVSNVQETEEDASL